MQLDDPTALALLAADALRRAGIEHALYGGLLLAAYGEARETRDADMAVAGAAATEAARALETSGLRTAVALERVRFGGLWLSRVTLVGGVDGSDLDTLDLVEPLSSAYARRALDRALDSTLRGQPIRVLTPEDFVVFELSRRGTGTWTMRRRCSRCSVPKSTASRSRPRSSACRRRCRITP